MRDGGTHGAGHAPALRIDAARLWQSLEDYARYGGSEDGGVDRPVFSAADSAARNRLRADAAALGLAVRVDAAANLWCRREGTEPDAPPILLGSHLDSVPHGGRFDGPLGVLCGLEVLRTLADLGIQTHHPVTLVSLTGEEATSFGTSTFGSRALAGRLPDLAANRLPDGRSVREALAQAGGEWDRLPAARVEVGPIACFLEVHIEQGTRLERAGHAIGVVSGVCGIHRQRITFTGEPGHAGTTAMDVRSDALRAASRLILAVSGLPAAVAAADPSAAATVGFLEVEPNTPNVIPGRATAITDLRSAAPETLAALARAAARAADLAARQERVAADVRTTLDQAPIAFDRDLRTLLGSLIAPLGGHPHELSSLAGHDAVHLAALAPTAMLFVRCAGGLSHRPDERVAPDDAAVAAESLLRSVLAIDATRR